MAIRQLRVTLTGLAPLLMKSRNGLDPLHPIVRQIAEITVKKAKERTDDDLKRLTELEWEVGLYFDEALGPYVPAEWIEGTIRDAAKKKKMGKQAQIGVVIPDMRISLAYKGPRDLASLKQRPDFRDVRPATNKGTGGKVNRVRPIFHEWSLTFTLHCDDSVFGPKEVETALLTAGMHCGIGDFRPSSPKGGKYGRFGVTNIEEIA